MIELSLPVADPWFRVRDAGDGVTWLDEPHVDPLIMSNVWLVPGRDRALVVDAGNGFDDLSAAVRLVLGGLPVVAVATHGHFDHVGGLAGFDDRRCHPGDADEVRTPYPMRVRRANFPEGAEEMYADYRLPVPELLIDAIPSEGFDVDAWVSPGAEPTAFLAEGDVVDLGGRVFDVLHVPGHTAGGLALWEDATGLLFTGDMLYLDEELGFEGVDDARASLARMRELAPRRVLPGHGDPLDAAQALAMIDQELARLGVAAN
jgi:glyoxylase-like metal-dependent hydrolase (beta-lactamase superfamily II)